MLKLTGVNMTFKPGSVNEKRALIDVNLVIHPGDFVTVIGGNGAGKSTLLNVVAGVCNNESGRIVLDGIDITRKPEYKRAAYLGRVFQDPMMGTAAGMIIEENLAMAKRRGKRRSLRWEITREERAEYCRELAKLGLGLEERLQDKVGLLSGGQRQALTLLMATLQKPKMLLLDEHTAALDPKTARKVLQLTQDLVAQEQLTTLMITHNMKDALRVGNRLIMMYEGRVIFDVEGEEKRSLDTRDLMEKFEMVSGGEFANDRMMLG
ncbi:ATP-binding cassette domain-containing protein [Ruminococcaceae bacterium OttesenSCG-928-I18]|nr:ATP-binding cassette domain-containing protein [Ruminococcaceae bacterium OttesenSCG-928-I18]